MTKNQIKYSIICSAYNAQKTLKDSILSVLNNDYECFEVLIINDGSTDKTWDICQELTQLDNRVKVFNMKNKGPYNERIFGYKQATGDYLLSIDADDTFESFTLSRLSGKIISNNHPDLIIFNTNIIENQRKTVLDKQIYPDFVIGKEDFLRCYLNSYSINQALYRKCFKKEVLAKNIDLSDRNYRMYEDGLFSLRVIANCQTFLFENLPLYNYYIGTNFSLTKQYRASKQIITEVFVESAKLFSNITNNLENKYLFDSIMSRFYFNKLISFSSCMSFKEYYDLVKKQRFEISKELLCLKTPYRYMKKMWFFKKIFSLKILFIFALLTKKRTRKLA